MDSKEKDYINNLLVSSVKIFTQQMGYAPYLDELNMIDNEGAYIWRTGKNKKYRVFINRDLVIRGMNRGAIMTDYYGRLFVLDEFYEQVYQAKLATRNKNKK